MYIERGLKSWGEEREAKKKATHQIITDVFWNSEPTFRRTYCPAL
jgi:hypothetical protein